MVYKGTILKYSQFLSVNNQTPIISISEGRTPLVPAPYIAKQTGVGGLSVYLKMEGMNPT